MRSRSEALSPAALDASVLDAPALPQADVCFLFDNQRAGPHAAGSLLFERCVRRITARSREEVEWALAQVEQERVRGRYVCGYVAYEARPFVTARRDAVAGSPPREGSALVDFFAFDAGISMTGDAVARWLARRCGSESRAAVHTVRFTETRETYQTKLRAIQSAIVRGDTYQVNFTFKCRFGLEGSATALYLQLRERQRVEFGAYARLPDQEILSLSPELFVRRQGEEIACKPMKGTAARGGSPDEDARIVTGLKTDPKTLSENVMIVDLMRSDLGRIAEIGSVRVADLFEVESFETVHQMVSTVRATVDAGLPVSDVLRAVFPCGSVTGAPKGRAMQIIESLEAEARGIYTGALGWVAPGGDFCFSVPIRTVAVQGGQGEMGIGSGIVHESDPDAEWAECLLKASFLTRPSESLRILETLRFDPASGGAPRLDAHLDRMAAAAATFHFAFDRARVVAAIDLATGRPGTGSAKVRVSLAFDGSVDVSLEPLAARDDSGTGAPWVAVGAKPIDSTSCFRRHKTSARQLYDEEYRAWREAGAYDVVFLNERGEVAEASRHNVFIERGGRLFTPALASGALPGIERKRILDDPSLHAVEAALSLHDLLGADRVLLTNAVVGIVPVDVRLTRKDGTLPPEA